MAGAAKSKPAAAKAAATAKSAKTPPVPASAKAFYAAMPETERNAIESDLVWTGDYNGMVGAAFEERAIAAVQSFQKRNGGKETGILNPDERSRLAQGANARQEQAGWRVVDDPATGARLGLPVKLVPQATPGKGGSHWQSARGEVQVDTFRVAAPGTTLAAVFEQQKKEPATRKVDYNVLRADFFVLSGLQGLKKFYVRGQVKDNDVRGITILYDRAMEGIVDPVAVAMSSAFVPFPAPVAAEAGAAPRRPVEYGTGFVSAPRVTSSPMPTSSPDATSSWCPASAMPTASPRMTGLRCCASTAQRTWRPSRSPPVRRRATSPSSALPILRPRTAARRYRPHAGASQQRTARSIRSPPPALPALPRSTAPASPASSACVPRERRQWCRRLRSPNSSAHTTSPRSPARPASTPSRRRRCG